jgi:hypothetical protein
MADEQQASPKANNYGFNDDGIKGTGPGQSPVPKRIPLMSIVFTLSFRVVEVEDNTQESGLKELKLGNPVGDLNMGLGKKEAEPKDEGKKKH